MKLLLFHFMSDKGLYNWLQTTDLSIATWLRFELSLSQPKETSCPGDRCI